MLNVFVGRPLPRYRHIEPLYPNLGAFEGSNVFGEKNPFADAPPLVKTVDSAHDADILLLPYPFALMRDKEPGFLSAFLEHKARYGKPLMVSAAGDVPVAVDIPADFVLRTSAYRSELSPRDIIAPPTIPDLGALYGVSLRQKEDAPTVSFCGFAAFSSLRDQAAFAVKDSLAAIGAAFSSRIASHRRGIHFRQAGLSAFSASSKVKTSFIVRRFHSSSAKTIGMDPASARRKYIENMKGSDFVFAPRGDGNYSLRFFEALSLGRIPAGVDTDMALPGGNELYEGVSVWAGPRRVGRLPDAVAGLYSALSEDAFQAAQARARSLFLDRLYAPRFYELLFTDIEQSVRASRPRF